MLGNGKVGLYWLAACWPYTNQPTLQPTNQPTNRLHHQPLQITDLVSFYTLPSTIINHPEHNELRAAYMYYTGAPLSGLLSSAACSCTIRLRA